MYSKSSIPSTSEKTRLSPTSQSFYPFVSTAKNEYAAQQSTFSYSYLSTTEREEYYYPVYNKHEWSEDESFIPNVENTKLKKKKEMDDRIKEINREFLDNRQILYDEKKKQLKNEWTAVETGQHEIFNATLADLEEKRRQTIQNAKLMMIYQISSIDEQCNSNSKRVQDESLAEKKEIQNALFSIIEEKRKKLKEDKDGEGELLANHQPHQTRNRKRLQRKRGELEGSPSSPYGGQHYKKRQERQKESYPSHLMGVLSHRVEQDIEADFYEIMRSSKQYHH